MGTNNLEERLNSVLADITDWLKFAEAKNALLITFNGAFLTFLVEKIFNYSNTNVLFNIVLIVLVLLNILSLFTCLISFTPKTFRIGIIDWLISKTLKEKEENDNILFYKDIAKYSTEEYYKRFQLKVMNDNETEKYDNERKCMDFFLTKQIVTLSKIAYEKYFLFNLAIILTMISVMISFCGFIIKLIFNT